MGPDHHRGLERMYLRAPCNQDFRPQIRVGDGEAEIRVHVSTQQFHGGGAVHGHVLFKALDDAAFFAASSRVGDQMVLTASFHVNFLRPLGEGTLTATGRVVSRTRRLVVAEAAATDERGHEVARGSGTFVPSGLPLSEVPGYVAR